ncbi:T9SS type B sorting domain-containing protein [Taibaiella lutea]|nr:gliding motility-associated C-terminal domain-containing protein [Taibaiella lutea]
MIKFLRFALQITLLCLALVHEAGAQKTDIGPEASKSNFTSFNKKRQATNMALWRQLNDPKYYNHPEFGILPADAPNENCIEIYSERTADKRFFRDAADTTKYYSQQALGHLNILKSGHWETIDHRLQSVGYKIYKSANCAEPVVFNLNTNDLAINTALGKISFNRWHLIAKDGMQEQRLAEANLQDYTAGEDGIYVNNIFNGIDAELKVYRGAVKTNFIIKSMQYGKHDMLIFRDEFSGTGNTKLEFMADPMQKYGTGEVAVFHNGNDVLHINQGVGYVKDQGKDAMIELQYQLNGSTLDILVPGQWIEDNAGHQIIIDPLVTGTATLAANAIVGSGFSFNCYNAYCAYNLNANVPPAATITNVAFTFTYIASGACWRNDGGFSFHTGNCMSPSANGAIYFCNLAGGGSCSGTNFSIMDDVANCLPAPSCAAQTIPFQMRFYRCFNPSPGCSGTCIGAGSPWTMTITGRTVEFQNPNNAITLSAASICQGESVTATAAAAVFGVPPYTYSWSLNPTGVPVAATGSPANIILNNPGNNTIYLRVRDACDNTITAQRNITVHPVITANENITICANQLPYTWNGMMVNSGGNNAATFTSPATGTGCDSITTLNLTVNPILIVNENITICTNQLPFTWNGMMVNTGGNNAATFTSPATGTGCDSITTLNLTVNPTLAANENITICANQLPFLWNGIMVNMGGNNAATFTSPATGTGCDSITTLNLTVNPTLAANENITICANQLPFLWNGIMVNMGGNNAATFTSSATGTGCDSVTTLNLTVNPTLTANENITICVNQLPYTWNGIMVNMGGNNAATFTSPATGTGCDSVTTLNLTVNPTLEANENITICSSQLPFQWNGMMVNAGGNNAATFTSSATGTGCDSTTTLNLIVNPTLAANENITVCSSQLPYTWNGMTVNAGGNNAATFTSPATGTGCDSITTLNLTVNPTLAANENITICANQLPYTWNGIMVNMGGNNAATFTSPATGTGCDSTTTLNLTVNPTLTANENITICSNQLPFQWNGMTVNAGGNNAATFTSPANTTGCDSITTLNLTVNPTIAANENITICANQLPYTWNGIMVNMGGNNAATFTSPATGTGCDSTTTLNLTVNPTLAANENITICANQLPFLWNGMMVNMGGNNAATFISPATATGCDSTTTLNLTVNPTLTENENITVCANQLPFSWNGMMVNMGGNNAATFTSPATGTGCDSITTLNLTVNPTLAANENITICANQLPFLWNGMMVNAGGNNAATFTSTATGTGCDSTTTLNLTVNPTFTANENITICANQLPFSWNGIMVNMGGNNAATFTSPATGTGCDSVTTLNLTVNPTLAANENITICANQLPFLWNGMMVNAGGNNAATFTSPATGTGCDSITTLNLTVNPTLAANENITICSSQLPYTWNGVMVNAGGNNAATFTSPATGTGCDSITTLNLTVNPTLAANENITICSSQLPYTWNGMMVNAGGNNAATFTSPATGTGCDSVTTLNLTVNPVLMANENITICANQLPFLWNGIMVNMGGNNAATFTSPATGTGCDSVTTLNLTVNPPPVIAPILTITDCDSVTFEGITYIASQILQDTFYNVNNCDSLYRTIDIRISESSKTEIIAEICQGEQYRFDGEFYQNPGVYTKTYNGSGGCDSIRELTLTVHPLPVLTIDIAHDPLICVGDTLTMTGSGADRYNWFVNNVHASAFNPANIPLPLKENTIVIQGESTFQCVDSTSIFVAAEDCCGISIPNAFSPNSDGLNDKFGAITAGHPRSYKIQIFDRWGKKVFISYNIYSQWDGTFNGIMSDVGTYFYLIQSECTDGSLFQKKGEVILLR